jgi:hypothetical protein
MNLEQIKHHFIVLILSLSSFVAAASDFSMAKSRCQKPDTNEPLVYSSDFKWKTSRNEMKNKYIEIYESGKRLNKRAYYNGDDFIIPVDVYGRKNVTFKLTERFLRNITDHIEQGLANKYVDFIMFPDMGHSHFFIPEKFYLEELHGYAVNERDRMYEKLYSHQGLRILYHTAEQLRMLDENNQLINDRYTQWRFYTRNLIGFSDGSKRIELLHQELNMANTARDYKSGYKYWGAGFNISASKDGCFPFLNKGKIEYFDISLKDLESKPGSGGDFDF